MRIQHSLLKKMKQPVFLICASLSLLACASGEQARRKSDLQASEIGCPVLGTPLTFPSVDGKGTTSQFGRFIQSVQAFPDGKIEIKLTDNVLYRIYFEQSYTSPELTEATLEAMSGNRQLSEEQKDYHFIAGPGWCINKQSNQGEDTICSRGKQKFSEEGEKHINPNSFQEQLFTLRFTANPQSNLMNGSGHFSSEGNHAIIYLKNQEGLVVAFVEMNFLSAYNSKGKSGFPIVSREGQATLELYPLSAPVSIKKLDDGIQEVYTQKQKKDNSLFVAYSFINYPAKASSSDPKQLFQNELMTAGLDKNSLEVKPGSKDGKIVGDINIEKNLLNVSNQEPVGVRHHLYVELHKEKMVLGKIHLYRLFSTYIQKPKKNSSLASGDLYEAKESSSGAKENSTNLNKNELLQTEPVLLQGGKEYQVTSDFQCKSSVESVVSGK